MFVFLVLAILYPNGTLAGFATDLSSCKVVLEAIKFEEKPSCEYSLSFNFFFFLQIYKYINPIISVHHEQSLDPSLRMRGVG